MRHWNGCLPFFSLVQRVCQHYLKKRFENQLCTLGAEVVVVVVVKGRKKEKLSILEQTWEGASKAVRWIRIMTIKFFNSLQCEEEEQQFMEDRHDSLDRAGELEHLPCEWVELPCHSGKSTLCLWPKSLVKIYSHPLYPN